ncbi:MAG: sn-glycerol-3-phosphate ABC transporter ATP-binding protein UgpC [Chlorobi bacterium]|nr:sn-glycerol-3-phosphate ABC transporter ATP-binding protein UgpC [Chlorobiota bacterium]
MAKVELKNVSKIYMGGHKAVDNVSFNIDDKEFVVLVGPSGCGKTTTLRMIAGLEELSDGEIFIDGKPVKNVPPKDRNIAMVFQNYALYPHMTVYENMAFGLKIRKFPKNEIKKMVEETAEILELEKLLNRKPKVLSGGQRQRVALGRAIVRKPKVFLFDEPLSNLDAKLRVQMRAEISKLHRKLGATMIYVTHDQREAMTMGDRIVVMKDGIIRQIDKPLRLYRFPKDQFVAGFIGSPAMNFIKGKMVFENGLPALRASGGFLYRFDERLKEKLSKYINENAALGIRPENIALNGSSEQSYKAEIELIEPLGAESLYYLNLFGDKLIAKAQPLNDDLKYETVGITFPKEKVHLFVNEKAVSLK